MCMYICIGVCVRTYTKKPSYVSSRTLHTRCPAIPETFPPIPATIWRIRTRKSCVSSAALTAPNTLWYIYKS